MLSKTEINKNPFLQLLLIVMLCLVSVTLFSLLGSVLTIGFYDVDVSQLYSFESSDALGSLKLFQLLSAVGLFLIPPLVYSKIISGNMWGGLTLDKFGKPSSYILVLLLMIVVAPFISWIVELNSAVVFPDFLNEIESWMKESEQSAERLTKAFLTFNGFGAFLYVLLIVGIVPAIGEELLFRGVLQKIFVSWANNKHIGIWVTAILFSALHMQFYGFFPRMLLGVMFGYLLVWTGSLWLPILGHFINNGSVVLMAYLYPELINNSEITLFGDSASVWMSGLISLVLSLFVFLMIKKTNRTVSLQSENNENLS